MRCKYRSSHVLTQAHVAIYYVVWGSKHEDEWGVVPSLAFYEECLTTAAESQATPAELEAEVKAVADAEEDRKRQREEVAPTRGGWGRTEYLCASNLILDKHVCFV